MLACLLETRDLVVWETGLGLDFLWGSVSSNARFGRKSSSQSWLLCLCQAVCSDNLRFPRHVEMALLGYLQHLYVYLALHDVVCGTPCGTSQTR